MFGKSQNVLYNNQLKKKKQGKIPAELMRLPSDVAVIAH